MIDDPKVIPFPVRPRAGTTPAFYRWSVHVSADVTLDHFTQALRRDGLAVYIDRPTGSIFVQHDSGRPAA